MAKRRSAYLACSIRPPVPVGPRLIGRPQLEALDLAARRFRQLVDKLDPARILEGCQAFLDEAR